MSVDYSKYTEDLAVMSILHLNQFTATNPLVIKICGDATRDETPVREGGVEISYWLPIALHGRPHTLYLSDLAFRELLQTAVAEGVIKRMDAVLWRGWFGKGRAGVLGYQWQLVRA